MPKRTAAKAEVRDLSLPTEKTEPKVGLSDFRWMFHGHPKTGKTSTCAQFPNSIFLACEEGLNALEYYGESINNWQEFGQMVGLLVEEDHEFDTVIIDTMDLLYEYLKDRVAEENGVGHINELGFGAGYDEANRRLHKALEDLYHAGLGVVTICHSRYEELSHGRRKVTKAVPDLSNSPRQVLTGWVDIIIYMNVEEEEDDDGFLKSQFVAQCQPTPYVEAGGRLSNWMPNKIQLGGSPTEGFNSIREAFEDASDKFLESLS